MKAETEYALLQRAVEIAGGKSALARLIGKDPAQVTRWLANQRLPDNSFLGSDLLRIVASQQKKR
jgi:hypothetical protein